MTVRGLPWGRVLGVLVVVVFAWAVHHYWGWQKLFAPWKSVAPGLVALVVLAQLSSYSVRAFRIYHAEPQIPRGRWHDCLKLILLNNITNLLLPARTGEASFPLLMSRWFGVNAAKGSGTLLWLRLLDLGVLAVLALGVLGPSLFPGIPVAVVIVLCLAGVFAPLLALPIHAHAGRILAGRNGKVASLTRKLLDGVPGHIRQVLIDIGLSWTAWSLKLAALAVVFSVLADLPLPAALMGAIGGDLSTVLPVHAPGGFGTYEAGVVALVASVHEYGPKLLAAAVDLHLLVLGIALLGGAYAWLSQPRRT
ncbi:MAG: lysylphosphatidylglycerol synthase domain-containing protein [Aeromicrobium sp.]